ncbi:MAG TPA: TIM barrel protein [Chitinophagaceae bacterium]|nr:TIM barrel protein [Chitinophagaceae bacterium]
MNSTPSRQTPDDISLAQWALVEELQAGRWTNLDFPRIARQDFGINGIEFVNTFFAVPTETYLRELRFRARDQGVEMILIMVDEEGDGCSDTVAGRRQFVINHRKWVDIAHFLGCRAIRTNCRGPQGADPAEALQWAAESYHGLLDYAAGAQVEILIENHGGFSNDPDWLLDLMREVNRPQFGIYPDWRRPMDDFDNFGFLEKTLPYARGMSYRNQPTEELTARMIGLCRRSGYHGWYGIESNGRDEILKGIALLRKYLLTDSVVGR